MAEKVCNFSTLPQQSGDNEWKPLGQIPVSYCKFNNVLYLKCDNTNSWYAASQNNKTGTLPEGYRPKYGHDIYFLATGGGTNYFYVRINSDGSCVAHGGGQVTFFGGIQGIPLMS